MTVTRTFGNYVFQCQEPGRWETIAGPVVGCYGIYHMLAGTQAAQWEVYGSITNDPLDGKLIGIGLTMAEAVADAFDIKFGDIRRRHGIGSVS